MKERFMISAGGTGGHVFPALALARSLVAKGYDPMIVTDRRGARYVSDDVPSHVVRAASPAGGLRTKLAAIVDLIVGAVQSWRLVGKFQPAAVASFGGYASFPAAIAARLRHVPIMLHEQNAVFGRANRALARFADVIALSFAKTAGLPSSNHAKLAVTGNPVRPGFVERSVEFATERSNTDCILVTILGGSQGARILSDALPGALAALSDELRGKLKIAQQCRPEDLERVREIYRDAGMEVELATFFEDVPERMAKSHLIVTRSGASTVAELTVAGTPAILIPYLYAADNHQEANARMLSEQGAAIVVRQSDVSIEGMTEMLQDLLASPERLAEMQIAMSGLARPTAADQLAEELILLASRRKGS